MRICVQLHANLQIFERKIAKIALKVSANRNIVLDELEFDEISLIDKFVINDIFRKYLVDKNNNRRTIGEQQNKRMGIIEKFS